MKNRMMIIATVTVTAAVSFAGGGVPANARAVGTWPGGHIWGLARPVPGIARLSEPGLADIRSLSCTSNGDCSAVGGIWAPPGHGQGFVVSRIAGKWHKAMEVPGFAAHNVGGNGALVAVSCASPGNCSAGGWDLGTSLEPTPVVVSQVNGTWREVVELGRLGEFSEVGSISCGAPGNCAAGGYSIDYYDLDAAIVANQTNGTWHDEIVVPGIASFGALNQGGEAYTTAVSCASADNCTAAGSYLDYNPDNDSYHYQAFVADQINGTWHTAIQVPGTTALSHGNGASIGPLSCASAGNCSAAGSYTDAAGHGRAFLVDQVDGTWQPAFDVPGLAALDHGGSGGISSISCASPRKCTATGNYTDGAGRGQPFLISRTRGSWHAARPVPGLATLDRGGSAGIGPVSCSSAGNCSAGGSYTDSAGRGHAFLIDKVRGVWQPPFDAPGLAAINQAGGPNAITTLSCGPRGPCSATGSYTDSSGQGQLFLISQKQ